MKYLGGGLKISFFLILALVRCTVIPPPPPSTPGLGVMTWEYPLLLTTIRAAH